MKIAVMLTAVDNMSNVIQSSVDKSQKAINSMTGAMVGAAFKEVGQDALDLTNKVVKASANLQESQIKVKQMLMGKDGIYSESTFSKIDSMTKDLSEKYANNKTNYMDMVNVMLQNRITAKDILGGLGDSTAMVADLFEKMNPVKFAVFAAHMRNDMGIAANQMTEMYDVLNRMWRSGVGGGSAESAVYEMTKYYSKITAGMTNLRTLGLEEAKKYGYAGGYFMATGMSGDLVGNNIRRMLDNIRIPKHVEELINGAKKYGIELKFYDNGKFLGPDNMIRQLDKLKSLKIEQVADIIQKPFGGKQGLSADMVEMLVNKGLEGYDKFKEHAENMANVKKMFDIMATGYNYQNTVMDTNVTTLETTMGKSLLPLYTSFVEKLSKAITGLNDFFENHPRLTKVIMYTGLALSLLTVSFGSLLVVFSGAKILLAISGIGKLTTAILSLNMAALSNPFVLITLAVIALGLSLTYCYFHYPKFKSGLEDIGQAALSVGKIIEGLLETLGGLIEFDYSKMAKGFVEMSVGATGLGFGSKSYEDVMKATSAATSKYGGNGGYKGLVYLKGFEGYERDRNGRALQPIAAASPTVTTFTPTITINGVDTSNMNKLQDSLYNILDRYHKENISNQTRRSF